VRTANIDATVLPGPQERDLLRESVRGFLGQLWPAAGAIERTHDTVATRTLWEGLVAQGLTTLGHDPAEGGLREASLVMEELGRAACPVPLAGTLIVNLLMGGDQQTEAWLDDVRAGLLRLSAVAPHSAQAAGLQVERGLANGCLQAVDGGALATHLVAPHGDTLVLIDLKGSGVEVTPTRAMGLDGQACWSQVRLANTPVRSLALAPDAATAFLKVLRLLHLSRAHGAARRAFELVVAYAKDRHQFGKPIGAFQAIQHKLANALIDLEGVRLALESASGAFDLGKSEWHHFESAAWAFGASALRRVSLETHHTFGAIGYAEEHEAARHFRRIHLDSIVLGGAAQARRELAAMMLDDESAKLPEYDLGPAGNAFRQEVRSWLQAHWSGERKAAFDRRPFHDREYDPSFARDIGTTGWIGLGWPAEHGGQARSPREQIAFLEEMERAEAPPRIGASVQANALMMHGTPEQRARYLPEILCGQSMHGMGYSEPDAGSDLAALRTRAVRDGNEWVINGQKIWTTTWWGQYMFLAARTDPDAVPRHAGISMFIVPMDSPGISVQPAITLYDGSFANIFYDNVRIPAHNLVGPLNGGWKVLTDALANERGSVGGGIVLKVAHAFEMLCADVRSDPSLRDDPVVRDRIGTLAADIQIGRQLMLHCAELAEGGTTPPEMGAISKVFSGELMERFGEAALDILGPRAALSQGAPEALRQGRYEQGLRHSMMWVISIGTNEIQRSLIAQRALGLPR
jgi:alkylation response protein AidB-like acyl-CoA dehydrogenase